MKIFRIRKAKEGTAESEPSEDSKSKSNPGWIGVDLDGTLAEYDTWKGFDEIGNPVSLMKKRVLEWIDAGYTIKIVTARASEPQGISPVKSWLANNGFPELEVTNQKDFEMIELWDDRAVQVVTNTGKPVIRPSLSSTPRVPLLHNEQAGKTFESAKIKQEDEQ